MTFDADLKQDYLKKKEKKFDQKDLLGKLKVPFFCGKIHVQKQFWNDFCNCILISILVGHFMAK